MKKIDGIFDNMPVRLGMFLLLGFPVPGFFIWIGFDIIRYASTFFYVCAAISYFVSFFVLFKKGLITIRLYFNNVNGILKLGIKYATSDKIIFVTKYKARMLPLVNNKYRSQMYFELSMFDNKGRDLHFYERIDDDSYRGKNIPIIMNPKDVPYQPSGRIENLKPFPSTLWEIYQELEKHPECKNIGEKKDTETDTPFVE